MVKNPKENVNYWCVFDEDDESAEYFMTENSARNYVKKNKIKNYFIFKEDN